MIVELAQITVARLIRVNGLIRRKGLMPGAAS
jgi:hypothetical protein